MSLLSLNSATLTLGGKCLFAELGLRIAAADRIGLIGPNGSGKTSLLRLMAGEMEAELGELSRKQGLRVGYLPQQLAVAGGRSLLKLVRDSVPGRESLIAKVAETEQELSALEREAHDAAQEERIVELAAELAELQARLSHFEMDYADHVALRILAGLGFDPADSGRDVGELSGGWQMRAVLAALLFMQPDLLLLDEPTNHLDMPSVAWFSDYLKRYRHAFVLVSHDRELVNEQISRVVSFEPEGVRSYSGNYDSYLVQRAAEQEVLENRSRNLQREREKAEAFINRFRAQATKARAVQSRIRALSRLDEVELLEQHDAVQFHFPPTARTSREVLKVTGLCKSYGTHKVLDDVGLTVERGEKIGVIGVNGAGKTTLLKILAHELLPDAASITLGTHVLLGYYAQHHVETLDPDSTVFQEVMRSAAGHTPATVRNLLGALLLGGSDVDKQIRVLSGGEQARVALARLLLAPHNLLLMDEPTNHLDLRSSERLAEALATFDGSLVFVSHNRHFVRRLATRIWNVADGKVETYPGTLDEYMESAMRRFALPSGEAAAANGRATASAADKGPGSREEKRDCKRQEAEERNRRRTTLAPLKQRVTALEERISTLEAAQKERDAEITRADFFDGSPRCAELLRAYKSDAALLEELNAQWEEAAAELERKAAELP